MSGIGVSWRECDDYEVTANGEVWRVKRWLPRGRHVPYLLGQRTSNSGYLYVSVSVGGRPRHVFVHRLVMQVFCGDPPTPQHHVAHVDGNRLNNSLSNLIYATPAENAAHKLAHGTARSPRSLTAVDVIAIRSLYMAQDVSYRALAERFGVSAPTIGGVVTGRYWPHIPGAMPAKSKGRRTAPLEPSRHADADSRR